MGRFRDVSGVRGEVLVPGEAVGDILVSPEPLSFWGGFDPLTGTVTDQRHPLHGVLATGRVLVIPQSRGSSSSTAVLLEAVRLGTAPAAVLTTRFDAPLALAFILAHEMYGRAIPLVRIDPTKLERLENGQRVEVRADGRVMQLPSG